MTPLIRRAFARALSLLVLVASPALAQYGVPAPTTPAVNTACPPFTAFPLSLNLGSASLLGLDGATSRCSFSQVQSAINGIGNSKGAPNGIASLDTNGVLLLNQLPPVSLTLPNGGRVSDITLTNPKSPLSILGTFYAAAPASRLLAYGYIGDGRSHPLSGTLSFAGISTVGWTLAQWQAIYPHARALTDELDWAAIQGVVNDATAPVALVPPPGSVGMVNRPIVAGCQTLVFGGAGSLNAKIVQTAPATDLVRFAQVGDPCPITAASEGRNFEARNISFECAYNGCGSALKVALAPGTGQVVLENVSIRGGTGATQSGFFNKCAEFTNPSKAFLSHVDCVGNYGGGAGAVTTTSDAFTFTSGPAYAGSSTGTYYVSLNDVNVLDMNTCFRFTMPAATSQFTGGMEGVVGHTLNCTGALDGIIIDNGAYSTASTNPAPGRTDAHFYRAPQWFFHHSQFDVYRQALNAKYIANLKFDHNLVYLRVADAVSGTIGANDKILLNGIAEGQIDHNTFVATNGLAYNDIIAIAPALEIPSTVDLDHNVFSLNAPPAAAAIVVGGGAKGVTERASIWNGAAFNAGTPTKVLNASTDLSVRLESQFADFPASLGSDGKVTFHYSDIRTTDANGVITLPFFSGMFLSAPQVNAENGDYSAAPYVCVPIGTPSMTGTPSFQVKCIGAGAGITARINYTLSGR